MVAGPGPAIAERSMPASFCGGSLRGQISKNKVIQLAQGCEHETRPGTACVMDCSAIVRDLDLAFVLLPGQQTQKDIARWRPNWSCRQNSGRIAGSPKKGSFDRPIQKTYGKTGIGVSLSTAKHPKGKPRTTGGLLIRVEKSPQNDYRSKSRRTLSSVVFYWQTKQ